jgi:hypothetical protein
MAREKPLVELEFWIRYFMMTVTMNSKKKIPTLSSPSPPIL